MNSKEFISACNLLIKEKGIEKDTLINILEDVFSTIVKKEYGEESVFTVSIDIDNGTIEIFLEKTIVENVINTETEILLDEVKKLSDDEFSIGDTYIEIVDFLKKFGYRSLHTMKTELIRRIKEIEKEAIYKLYTHLVGEIIVGEIYIQKGNDIILLHEKNEVILPKDEQIPRERYKKGSIIRVIVKDTIKQNGIPKIIVSRSDSKFLAKLLTQEIPEIYDGIIEIKSVARDPGERAKVAVIANDDRVDPVGACVGMKGVRIHSIVRELSNENIDVIHHTDDDEIFIARALSPAKIKSVSLNKAKKIATIFLDQDQVSMAIGKNGQNIRLASKLTGYEIDIIRDVEEEVYDMDLSELREEIGEEIFQILTSSGFTTARDVLDAKRMTLLQIEGLDDEIIDDMCSIIQEELDKAEIVEDENESEENNK